MAMPQSANDSSGTVTWQADTEAFGAFHSLTTAGTTINIRFPGQYFDAESGFFQNGFRDYVPQWGSYLEEDPIALAGGENLHSYVGARPTRFVDSSGLEPWDWGGMDGGYGNMTPAADVDASNYGMTPGNFPPAVDQLAEAYALYLQMLSLGLIGPESEVADGASQICLGMPLSRVFGGDALGLGRSWTIINPLDIPNYRVAAGLFPENTGTHIVEGILNNTEGVTVRTALPGPNGVGGTIPEIVVPNPATQITITNVGGVNPGF